MGRPCAEIQKGKLNWPQRECSGRKLSRRSIAPATRVAYLVSAHRPGHRHGRAKDAEVIRLLHRHRGATLFTLDQDFFQADLCHNAYCLVWLDVRMDDAAYFLRKLLCHPKFNTRSARMGVVIRVRPQGLHLWRRNQTRIQQAAWV